MGSFNRLQSGFDFSGPDVGADGSFAMIALGDGTPLELTQTLDDVFEPGTVYTLSIAVGLANLTEMPDGFHNGYTGVQMSVRGCMTCHDYIEH
jgi:hypothetical protein